jgi:hypothetical protein
MLHPVSPVDQVITPPSHPVAVSIALPPSQTDVLSGVTIGGSGEPPSVITIVVENTEVPQSVVQVAVYVPNPAEIDAPVPATAPSLYQVIVPAHPLALKVALSVPQRETLSAVIAGSDG